MVWAIIKRWKYPILAVFALLFLICVIDPLATSILRSSRERKREQRQTAPRWRWFTNRDCGYIVEFPSKPFENPVTLSNRQNVISYRQFASALGSNHVFMVATLVPTFTNVFTDEQTKSFLSKAATGIVTPDDRLLERDIAMGTNIGKEVEILRTDGNFVKMRFYQVGHDLQQLVASSPDSDRRETNIMRFFDSFMLIE